MLVTCHATALATADNEWLCRYLFRYYRVVFFNAAPHSLISVNEK
jgi:hypothetical protein